MNEHEKTGARIAIHELKHLHTALIKQQQQLLNTKIGAADRLEALRLLFFFEGKLLMEVAQLEARIKEKA